MPSEITSMPCAFLSAILRSSWANRYGGMRSRRLLGLIQLLPELVAERGRVDALRPAGKGHVQVLAHLDLEIAPVEVDGHGALAALQHVGDGRAARTRAGRQRLPHAALEDACPDLPISYAVPERDVGTAGEQGVGLDRWAELLKIEVFQPLCDLDRTLRIA